MPEEQQFKDEFTPETNEAFPEPAKVEGEQTAENKTPFNPEYENRAARRWRERAQAEKEQNIALAARLQALSEAEKFRQEMSGKSVDERLLTLYGDNENGRKAAQITQSLLEDAEKRAEERALNRIQEAQRQAESEVSENENFIEQELESLEERLGIDLTEDPENRQAFLTLVEKYSPKDREGNIKEYADFDAVAEVFMKTREKPNAINKDLSSRSMVRSGSSTTVGKAETQATENYLKNLGII